MSIKKILSILALILNTVLLAPFADENIIVIAPYANIRSPGRTINGIFERGIALQCAELLKTVLERQIPEATVVIAKPNGRASADQEKTDLSAASFANTLGASFFFALSFYQEMSPQPHFCLYRYTYENDLPINNTELSFCPYDQLYRLQVNKSIALAKKLFSSFSSQQGNVCAPPCALPIKTLIGVAAPATLIEIGIPHDYAWQQIIEPLATGIVDALTR